MSGVLFVNPASGPDDCREELERLFADHAVVECDHDAFEQQVTEAIRDGAGFVAVAGGDGTIRSAAQVLRGGNVPLLPVPAGTRNHFAKSVDIATLERAAEAVDGVHRCVDLGDVNGKCFLNNSSIGLYPKLVVRRERHQRRLPKWAANIVAAWEQVRYGRRIDVAVDGVSHRAWMVFVGNGVYGDGLLDLADRESVASNTLDVRVIRADKALARTRVVGAVLFGRLARSPLIHSMTASDIRLDLRQPSVEVALDGEVVTLETPLHYVSQAGALDVLVPRETGD